MKTNATELERLFLRWLQAILRDARCRAVLQEELDRHELPVIHLAPRRTRSSRPAKPVRR
ncbi:MAG: hypothetical protein FJ387_10780 [Verrucomicrobia bacterium]|nr:hypothetical protein [Verrucomicrobiota bacterium]